MPASLCSRGLQHCSLPSLLLQPPLHTACPACLPFLSMFSAALGLHWTPAGGGKALDITLLCLPASTCASPPSTHLARALWFRVCHRSDRRFHRAYRFHVTTTLSRSSMGSAWINNAMFSRFLCIFAPARCLLRRFLYLNNIFIAWTLKTLAVAEQPVGRRRKPVSASVVVKRNRKWRNGDVDQVHNR